MYVLGVKVTWFASMMLNYIYRNEGMAGLLKLKNPNEDAFGISADCLDNFIIGAAEQQGTHKQEHGERVEVTFGGTYEAPDGTAFTAQDVFNDPDKYTLQGDSARGFSLPLAQPKQEPVESINWGAHKRFRGC